MGLAIAMILAYLIGSFPTAYYVAKSVGGISIFQHGSGNPGASNVYRVLGLKWAVLVVVTDVAKGFLPTKLAGYFADSFPPWFRIDDRGEIMVAIGLCAVIGHIYPVYMKFRGGKGVATMGGMLFAVAPIASSLTILVWTLALGWKKIFSLASLAAAMTFPFALYFFDGARKLSTLGWGLLVPLVLLITHHDNIRRLVNHDELEMKKKMDEKDG